MENAENAYFLKKKRVLIPYLWRVLAKNTICDILGVWLHLSSLEDVVGGLKKALLDDNKNAVHSYFDNARIYRDSFSNVTPGSFVKRYEISIDVLDKPGSIAIIAVLLSSNNINIKNMSIVNNRERENGVLNVSFDSEEQRSKSIELLKRMNYEVHKKD